MMKKYYSEIFNGVQKFSLEFLVIMDIFVPIMTILPIYDEDVERIFIFLGAFFAHIMLYSIIAITFGFVGPLPSNKKSMEWFAQMDNSSNGNPSCYFMNCVIPVKRKELLDLPVKLLLVTTAVHCLSLIVISFLGGEEMSKMSTAIVIIEALCIIFTPIAATSIKRKNNIIGAFMIGASALMLMLFVLIIAADVIVFTSLPLPILPLPIRIAIIIAAMLSNILFFRKTVYKGEFARNGEKVSD
ncbi:MAG: hypothetical protein ACI4SF_11710 [Oscillospiraceae bacterium]